GVGGGGAALVGGARAPPPRVWSAELIGVAGPSGLLGPEGGLGGGGVAARPPATAAPRREPGTAVSPGGVAIDCRREGVRLTFPGGADLLFAPDGFLHLRRREHAGPVGRGGELPPPDRNA